MSCTNYREKIQDWFDAPGAPSMPDELRDHVRVCTDCTQHIRNWNSLEISLRSIRDQIPQMSADFRSNLNAAIIEREKRTVWMSLKHHRSPVFAFAASAAVIGAIAIYMFSGMRQSLSPSTESMAAIHSPIPVAVAPKSQPPNQ